MKAPITDEARRAIEAIDKRFMEDANRGNAADGAAAYTGEAIIMPPNHSPIEGRQAIEQYLAEIAPQLQDSGFQLSISEIDVLCDTAIVRGAYSISIMVSDSKAPMEDRGKTLQVWRKQDDGSWKIHRDVWNSNIPVRSDLK